VQAGCRNSLGTMRVLCLAGVVAGCYAPIPKAVQPAQVQGEVPRPFDTTWDAVLRVADSQGGHIITARKSSGVITYRVGEKERATFMTVFLRPAVGVSSAGPLPVGSLRATKSQGTVVYVAPSGPHGPKLRDGIDVDFFRRLDEVLAVEAHN
jgi:hypothetical protein